MSTGTQYLDQEFCPYGFGGPVAGLIMAPKKKKKQLTATTNNGLKG